MVTFGKSSSVPTRSSVSLDASAAAMMALRLVLSITSRRSVSSRAISTSQEIFSLPIRLSSSSRRINNNNNNNNNLTNNKIFVRRYCDHHLDDDDRKPPPLENIKRPNIYGPRTPIPFNFGVERHQRYVIDTVLFAVNYHNQKENAKLQFVRALKVDYVPVGGVRLYITFEVQNAGKCELYHTVVFFRPWTNYRKILELERVEEPPLYRDPLQQFD